MIPLTRLLFVARIATLYVPAVYSAGCLAGAMSGWQFLTWFF